MLGFNFRMTGIEAAISRVQLTKLKKLIDERVKNVAYLENRLKNIPCSKMPKVRENATLVYYVHPIVFDEKSTDIHRNSFIDAVKAELPSTLLRDDSPVLLGYGYVKPLYLHPPLYQERVCFGEYPFSLTDRVYKKGDCPVCEKLHSEKVWENREELN